jgi:hypothetical protein
MGPEELTDEERAKRGEAARAFEQNEPIRTWWLSFADDGEFLGVAVVRARGVLDAIDICNEHGCGTGGRGEVHGVKMVEGKIAEKWFGRLLTESEVSELNAELRATD